MRNPFVEGHSYPELIEIRDYDGSWPTQFEGLAATIRAAVPDALKVEHVGSTAVPGQAAKDVIDVDLTVPNPSDEDAYIPALVALGYRHVIREPWWHEHRMLRLDEPRVNLHIFGPGSPELIRHRLLRDWLRGHPEDRARYAAAKRVAVDEVGREAVIGDYNAAKQKVIREILDRALVDESAVQGVVAPGPLPAAVLWDMDGTLVDTEPHWIAAEMALVARHGGVWTEADALGLVGNPLPESARILRAAGVGLPIDDIIATLTESVVRAVGVRAPWQPGALELLTALRAHDVPCALVTMSYRDLADAVVGHLPAGTFATVVSGDEVANGKPAPDPYLLAAARLGVDPGRCVAIEDSPVGIASARAAGAATLGVEAVLPVAAARGLSRAPSLAVVDVATIGRIGAGEVVDLIGGPSGA